MLKISNNVSLDDNEITFEAIRAQGSGGQKVNKTSVAIHLRFDISASSLPDFYKEKLLSRKDKRITKEGIIVIKSQQHRSQEQNRDKALERLVELIKSVNVVQKKAYCNQTDKRFCQSKTAIKEKTCRKETLTWEGRFRVNSLYYGYTLIAFAEQLNMS
jgi:ribosome-associated protein